jgi:hypothetical protein
MAPTASPSTSAAEQPTLPALPDLPAPVAVPSISDMPTVTVEPAPGGGLPAITTPSDQDGPTTPSAALIALRELTVANEQRAGYKRELFDHWVDADGDGCDTRTEVLAAESLDLVQIDPYGCRVVAGRWYSSYDGVETDNPSDIDIDHVVALAEAWDSGAWAWDAARRKAFANDLTHPETLAAVSSVSNRTKSDKDPADWLPRNETVCLYLTQWVAVKVRWALTVDTRERAALDTNLSRCQDVPAGGPVPEVSIMPVPAPVDIPPTTATDTPVMPPDGTSLDPMFPSCTAAKAAGYGPYRSGVDPEYVWYRDRDGDGVVCE